MQKNTISRVPDYYMNREEFEEDIIIAMKNFFEVDTPDDFMELSLAPEVEGWFSEWFVYHYFLRDNQKSVLEDYHSRNPHNLSEEELCVYQELQHNVFSLFEIIKIKKEEFLTLRDLQTGKHYLVREKMGTRSATCGHLIFGRISKLGDHFELVGSDPIKIPTRIGKELRHMLKQSDERLSPKTMYEFFKNDTPEDDSENDRIDFDEYNNIGPQSLTEAKQKFNHVLKEHRMSNMISADIITEWIYGIKKETDFTFVTMVTGLAHSSDLDEKDTKELIMTLMGLYQFSPQKKLKGKSPHEKSKEENNKVPDIITNQIELFPSGWNEHAEKARENFTQGDFFNALFEYDNCFELLLKNRTTFPEVYRIFANAAMVHFSLGGRAHGKRLLDIALELNPNYDFAISVKKRLESGSLDSTIDAMKNALELLLKDSTISQKKYKKEIKIIEESKKAIYEDDPALQYYEYLKPFNINFKTKELTKSNVTFHNASGEKIKTKRNGPCPCGAKQENETLVKYKKCCGR